MNPHDLLAIAERLARGGVIGSGRGRPPQAELRRAVSATYYAMFHALALCCANTLVGATRANRSQPAWDQVYRTLEHGFARNQCSNRAAMREFPPDIRNFGELFVFLQRERHSADYNPNANFLRLPVLYLVEEAKDIITQFENADARERQTFAAFVLFRLRRD